MRQKARKCVHMQFDDGENIDNRHMARFLITFRAVAF